ncbi:MAG TPA: EamA family transporter [Firmicutes bacterium]|jgi:drug/metabolite transporter (DMT)-like permease|nr:EamA family transporter [Bacillota bacterium]
MNKMLLSHNHFKMQQVIENYSHLAAVIGAVLLWSISFVATKIAFTAFPPLTLGALRFILAALLLGIVLLLKQGLAWPSPGDLGRLIVSGLLGITIYFAMENLGVKLATAADAALIVASYPAITMLLELLIYRIAISKVRFLGVLLAIAGVSLIVRESSHIGGSHRYIGDIILIATGIIWSFYNFVTRKVVNKYPTILITFYQTLTGAVAFLPLAWIERSQWHKPSWNSLLALFYLGLFCSVIAFLLYAYGLKRLASSSAVSLMNLVPIFGVIFAICFLHEPLSGFQFLGGMIVIAGIAFSVRQESKKCIKN